MRQVLVIYVICVGVLTVNCVLVRFRVDHVPLQLVIACCVGLRVSKRVWVFDVICTGRFHQLLRTRTLFLHHFDPLLHNLYSLMCPLRLLSHETRCGLLCCDYLGFECALLALAGLTLGGD